MTARTERVRTAGTPVAEWSRSPECELAGRPGYEDLHGACRRTGDVPHPHAPRIQLLRRCGCRCHAAAREVTCR